LTAEAEQIGVSITQTLYAVDGGANIVYTGPFQVAATGGHTITFHSQDSAGNVETTETQPIFVDIYPPQTSLLIDNKVPVSTSTPVIISSAAISFSTADAGSGVAETFFAIDGGTQTIAVSTFSMTVGTHTLVF
jgi:hypothetical protein